MSRAALYRTLLHGGGGVEHARAINLMPPSMLRMSGAFGPLQSSGLPGTLSWALSRAGSGTKVELTYSVGGSFGAGSRRSHRPRAHP